MKKFRNASLTEVKVHDSVMSQRIAAGKAATIPSSLTQCYKTGRIDAFKLNWKPGMPDQPHIFWDSDVAKVIEGMAYMLATHPDAAMSRHYDELIDLIASAQQPDGYLNLYFTCVEPEKRWTNIYDCHELYCAGHLIEAAVAGYQMLGKRKLLDVMCKYADYIDTVFGREEGKLHGYPGHEEIELALVRLYETTGNERYLKLAKYFVDERGTEPNFFEQEGTSHTYGLKNRQAHKPVREQTDADGHSVRALYLYSGMADVAAWTGDEELLHVCERLFTSIAERRMYVTGGVGSAYQGEMFTIDYDLSNGALMYAESCAAISLVYFASRMYNITGDGRYADVAERAIYNGVLSGISLSGDRFFYTNYLEVDDNTYCYQAGSKVRQEWFGCSCCPTNFCRFIPQMVEYLWSVGADEVRLNIPAANRATFELGTFEVTSRYPYDGAIQVEVLKSSGKFKLALRIPGWVRGPVAFTLNGQAVQAVVADGYATIEREWHANDRLAYTLPMPIETVHSNLKITTNTGRVALQRGPLVYCCETIDNPSGVANLVLDLTQPFELVPAAGLPDGTLAIRGSAWRESAPAEAAQQLYFTGRPEREAVKFLAIPYALWQNRGAANMAVWMRAQ